MYKIKTAPEQHTMKSSTTIKELKAEIERLQEEKRIIEERVNRLSIDPGYGILTRQALEMEVEARKGEFKYLAFGDVDRLHDFNSEHGHEEANARIRRALHVRVNDIVGLVTGKHYSGDEVSFLFDGDPQAFCNRIQEGFTQEGMSITIVWVPFTGDYKSAVEAAKTEVFRLKAARGIEER